MQNDKPLIVQSDKTLLLDVHAPKADECRNDLIPFAELERSPEYLHTYRLTPLSLWNAASAGFTAMITDIFMNMSDYKGKTIQYERFVMPIDEETFGEGPEKFAVVRIAVC